MVEIYSSVRGRQAAAEPSVGPGGSEAGEPLKALADGGEVTGISKDDEDGVVAGEGADDLRPLFPVEGDGDGLCAAGERFYQEEVPDAIGAEIEGREEAGEGWRRVGDVGGYRVGGAALIVGDLDEPQFTDIAGEGRLGDLDAAASEELPKDFLRGHAIVADEVEDLGVPLGLQHRSGAGMKGVRAP
jgi:hypothetical protein